MSSGIVSGSIEFTPQQMSESVQHRFTYLAEAMQGILNGSTILTRDVTIVALEDHIVASRQRTHTEWKPAYNRNEFVDIRIGTDGSYEGFVKGPCRGNRVIGDRLAAKTIFEHLLSMCTEVGIEVKLPNTHQVEPRT